MTQKSHHKIYNLLMLALTCVSIYLMAPLFNFQYAFWISLAFALINVLNSKVLYRPRSQVRVVAYIAISLVTYQMLIGDQPWAWLTQAGFYQSSLLPLLVCCLVMTFAGYLILPDMNQRVIYTVVTLGIQIPLAFLIGTEGIQSIFMNLAEWLGYRHSYSGIWEIWQLEWMMCYALPIYFLSRIKEEPCHE